MTFEVQGGYVPPLEPIEPVVTTQEVLSMQPAPRPVSLTRERQWSLSDPRSALMPLFFGPRMSAIGRDPFTITTYYASGQWPEGGNELWGVATSVNGGESWSETGLVNVAMFEDIAVATDTSGVIAGVWASQVHISEDAGLTWASTMLTSWVDDLVFQSTEPMVLLLAGPTGIEALNIDDESTAPLVTEGVSAIDRVGQSIACVTSAGTVHLCNDSKRVQRGSEPNDRHCDPARQWMANPEVMYLLTNTRAVFRSPNRLKLGAPHRWRPLAGLRAAQTRLLRGSEVALTDTWAGLIALQR